MMMLRIVAAFVSLFIASVHAVNSIEVKNQEFVDSVTNKRFYIIGVDYQPGGQSGYNPDSGKDALSNGTACLRDAALLQSLGVNTIRVYNVDPTVNHDDCASIFNYVGIYMIVDVNSPLAGESIDRSNPSGSYTLNYLKRIFSVVEAFKAYPNTLGFFAANEVINDVPTSQDNPPYIRAVQRDLKNYIAKQSTRSIPVGYSAADVREVLQDTWSYLQCRITNMTGTDTSRSDFFGLNSYSWCGSDATFQSAGYDTLVSMFSSTTIPVFFSEYGCNTPSPRVFNEVSSIYGDQMTTLSGGLVYEYSEEPSNYGLVTINDNSTISIGTDYDNLQTALNKLNITLIESANGTATSLSPPSCAASLITSSDFSKDFDVPSAPDGADDLINNGVSNPPQGKIIDVTATKVPVAVYGSNGNEVSGLSISPVADGMSNTPNGGSTSGKNGTSTSGGSSPSSTKKGTAARASSVGLGGVAVVAMAAVALVW